MARKTNNDRLDNINYDSEYFEKCWSKFTALTDEERQNLRNRAIAFKTYKKKLIRQKMNIEQKERLIEKIEYDIKSDMIAQEEKKKIKRSECPYGGIDCAWCGEDCE